MLYVSICLLIFGLFGWKCRSFHEDLINISDFILYIRGTKLIFTNLALYLKCHESQHFLNGSGKEQWQRIATQIQQNFFISCFMFFYADNLVSYLLSRYLKTISSLHWTKAYKTLTPRSCRTTVPYPALGWWWSYRNVQKLEDQPSPSAGGWLSLCLASGCSFS